MVGGSVRQVIHEAERAASTAANTAGARVAHTAGKASDKHLRRKLVRALRRSRASVLRRKPTIATEAILTAKLARASQGLVSTSHELAQESTDLREAVDSLGAVAKANREVVPAHGRRTLVFGLALGAALMYHLDVENGGERRAATARRLRSLAIGAQAATSPGLSGRA